jgi:hypothetical protein
LTSSSGTIRRAQVVTISRTRPPKFLRRRLGGFPPQQAVRFGPIRPDREQMALVNDEHGGPLNVAAQAVSYPRRGMVPYN